MMDWNASEYDENLKDLIQQYNIYESLIGLIRSECKDGVDIWRAEYNMMKIRHECFCLAACNRFKIEYGEKKIRDVISTEIPEDCYYELERTHKFSQTPDICKVKRYRQNDIQFVEYKWTEIAVSKLKLSEINFIKNSKYHKLITEDLKKYLEENKVNKSIAYRTMFEVAVVHANLDNWSSKLNMFGSPTDMDFEDKCYVLANKCNSRLHDIEIFLDTVSEARRKEYKESRARQDEEYKENIPLPHFKPRIDIIKGIIDDLPRSTKHIYVDMMDEDVLVKQIAEKCLQWANVNSNYFTPPNKDMAMNSFEKIESEVCSGDYKFIEYFNDMSPTFHFMYKLRDHADTIGFEQAFVYLQKIVSECKESDCLLDIVKDLSTDKITAKDNEIFFSTGYIDDWKNVKKKLKKVQEPKTMKWTSVNKNSRNRCKELYGIKNKKELLKERSIKKSLGETRSMKTINLNNEEMIHDCITQVEKKAVWLTKTRIVKNYDIITPDENMRKMDEKFNQAMNIINGMACEELSQHIRRVSSQLIFKSNSTGHGVYTVYTGNKNVWIFTLPGGDITNKEGDVRFFSLVIEDLDFYRKYGTSDIFNSEIVESVLYSDRNVILISKVFSLNRQRWEHLNSVDPGAFTALMCSRFGFDNETSFRDKFSGLIFAYYYCALGCQAKLSSLVDHFRYMIPASLAEKSALNEYIESKLKPAFKTAGQIWIYLKLKECCLKYLDEGSRITMNKQIRIVDEDFDEDSLGLNGKLSSLFITDQWDSREGALSEVYVAFHLTGKGFHNPFHRDIGFIKTVMGNEIDFQETWGHIEEKIHNEGMEIDDERLKSYLTSDRGGLFCKQAVMLSAYLSTSPALLNQESFCRRVEKEGLTENILHLKKLTTTRSSLTSRLVGTNYKYNASQAVLQTSLDEIKEEYRDEMSNFCLEILPKIKNCFNRAYKDAKESPEENLDIDPNPVAEDWHGSTNSALIKEFQKCVRDLKKTDCFMTNNYTLLQQIEKRLKEAKTSQEIRALHIFKDEIISKNTNLFDLFEKKKTSDTNIKHKLANLTLNQQKVAWSNFLNYLKEENVDIYRTCREWELSSIPKNGFVSSLLEVNNIKKYSVLYMSLKHIKDNILSKIVPKGQRTEVDREIFVQNNSRYIYYVMEHYFAALCQMNPMEAISMPGDEKMTALKKMVIRAFKWKQKNVVINIMGKDYTLSKKIRFITGDLQKFSNHDTDQRLAAFTYYTRKNLKGELNEYVYQLSRLCSRKQVLAPATLCSKELDQDDPIVQIFKKNNSSFPLFNSEKCNWFQGMRNFASSCAHVGVAKTIKRVFAHISDDLYYDSLVHSDDFASVIGYVDYQDIVLALLDENHWRIRHGIKDVEDFMISSICNIYRMNNLFISKKKSSISKNTIEFVSYLCMGGSVYMGYEKQLFSMYSEKTGKGPREDTVAAISQASGSLTKGCPSFIVDVFLDRALESLRFDYSMGENMRYDPCSMFHVPRNLLPLAFIPKLNRSSLAYTLTKPELHDVELLDKLNFEMTTQNLSEEQENSIKLLMAMSCKELGKINLTEIENKFDDLETVIPGVKFRGKNNKEVREKLKITSWLEEDDLRIISCMDESSVIAKPKDAFYLLITSLLKLCSNDLINGMSSRNKLATMRMKADFKNKEVATLNSLNGYTTLDMIYKIIKSIQMSYVLDKEFKKSFTKLVDQATFIHNSKQEKMNLIINSEMIITNNKVRKGKDLIRLPINDSYKVFINKSTDIIIEMLYKDRYQLNSIDLRKDPAYREDSERLQSLLNRTNFWKLQTPFDRMRCLEMIVKYSPDHDRPLTIVTTPMKGSYNTSRSVRHVLSNNLHPTRKLQVDSLGILSKHTNIDNTMISKSKKFVNLIGEISTAASLEIRNKDFGLRLFVAGETLKRYFDQIKTTYSVRDLKLYSKHKKMYAFLDYYLDKSVAGMDWALLGEYHVVFETEDKKYHRKHAYSNINIRIFKEKRFLRALFDGKGNMTIETNGFIVEQVRSFMRFFYNYTKKGYSLDNYNASERFGPEDYIMVGSEGNYKIIKAYEKGNRKPIALVKVTPMEDADYLGDPELDEENLRYKWMGCYPANVARQAIDINTAEFSVEITKDNEAVLGVDVKSAFRDGIINEYINKTGIFRIDYHKYFLTETFDPNRAYNYAFTLISYLKNIIKPIENFTIEKGEFMQPSEIFEGVVRQQLEEMDSDISFSTTEDTASAESDDTDDSFDEFESKESPNDDDVIIQVTETDESRSVNNQNLCLRNLRNWLALCYMSVPVEHVDPLAVAVCFNREINFGIEDEIKKKSLEDYKNDSKFSEEDSLKFAAMSERVISIYLNNPYLNKKYEKDEIKEFRRIYKENGPSDQVKSIVNCLIHLIKLE